MKEIVESIKSYGIICKTLKQIKLKELGSRKRIGLYLGVDLKSYFCSVILLEKKSRVVKKEALELIELHKQLEKYHHAKITKRYILIKAPLCSHAKKMFEESGWKVWHEERV